MAKRSSKHTPQSENDQGGCMWGLFCFFHFHNGHFVRRLISDRRRGHRRHASGKRSSKRSAGLLTNVDGKCKGLETKTGYLSDDEENQIESLRRSIKTLLDEEMSKGTQLKKQKYDSFGKSACYNGSHYDTSCKSLESHSPMERSSALEDDHPKEMNETDSFHSSNIPIQIEGEDTTMQLMRKEATLKDRETVAMNAFLIQKFIDAKQFLRDESLMQSKELTDALNKLNLDKELFLKIMQDPNSVLVKYIQELQDARDGVKLDEGNTNSVQSGDTVTSKNSRKQSVQSFFRRKDKPKATREISGSVALNCISNSVSTSSPRLSPQSHFRFSDQVENETTTSYFSMREIKRKWKRIVGENKKERHRISMDSVLHKIPYGHQDRGDASKEGDTEASFRNERIKKPSTSQKKNEPGKRRAWKTCTKPVCTLPNVDGNLSMNTVQHSRQREVNIYEEAKKHLSEMLSSENEDGDEPYDNVPRSLGRLLSLPEFMSPRLGPGKEDIFPTELVEKFQNEGFHFDSDKVESLGKEEVIEHSYQSSSIPNDHKNVDPQQHLKRLSPDLIIVNNCASGDLTKKGVAEFEEIKDAELIIPTKQNSDHDAIKNQLSANGAGNVEGKDYPDCQTLGSIEEKQQKESSPSSIFGSPVRLSKVEEPPSICEKAERPSPVSVLEPFCIDDACDNKTSSLQQDELAAQPRQIHFEENSGPTLLTSSADYDLYQRTISGVEKESDREFECVKIVLEASGLTRNDLIGRCHSSYQVLHPSLEEEASSGQSSDNQKLLFDFMSEVLLDVHGKFYRCLPWVSFAKPNIRAMLLRKYVDREIWKEIDWHLLQKCPMKLEQIIGKEMTKDEKWLDFRLDVESVGIEIEDSIIDELLDETAYDVLL